MLMPLSMVVLPLSNAVGAVIGIVAEDVVAPQAAVTVTPTVTLPEHPAVKVMLVPVAAEVSVPPEIVHAYVAPLTAAVEALPAAEATIDAFMSPGWVVITTGLQAGWDHPETVIE